jgi:hypothetical protein
VAHLQVDVPVRRSGFDVPQEIGQRSPMNALRSCQRGQGMTERVRDDIFSVCVRDDCQTPPNAPEKAAYGVLRPCTAEVVQEYRTASCSTIATNPQDQAPEATTHEQHTRPRCVTTPAPVLEFVLHDQRFAASQGNIKRRVDVL